MKTRDHHVGLTELNITPLMDLVFVLLVIFIITTPQLMNHIEMVLPSNQTTPQTNKVEPLKLFISKQGAIQIGVKMFTLDELKTELLRQKNLNSSLSMVVRGADAIDYQTVVDVLEVISASGITQVGLNTNVKE